MLIKELKLLLAFVIIAGFVFYFGQPKEEVGGEASDLTTLTTTIQTDRQPDGKFKHIAPYECSKGITCEVNEYDFKGEYGYWIVETKQVDEISATSSEGTYKKTLIKLTGFGPHAQFYTRDWK